MSVDFQTLPKNEDSLILILDSHIAREVQNQACYRARWELNRQYLEGRRNFRVVNYETGMVRSGFLSDEGELIFKYQKLLDEMNTIEGRLMQLDCWPSVSPNAPSLEDVQQGAMAQLIANNVTIPEIREDSKEAIIHSLLLYGCVAHMSAVEADHVGNFFVDEEIIHPSEILPFPDVRGNVQKLRGIIRRRVVQEDHLKDFFRKNYGPRKYGANKNKIEQGRAIETVEFGRSLNVEYNTGHHGNDRSGERDTFGTLPGQGKQGDQHTRYVTVEELWMYGPNQSCSRYIMKLGNWIAIDEDYAEKGVLKYCPIQFERMVQDGTFYGQSFVDLKLGLHREIEKALSKMFTDARNLDKFGLVLLPQGMGEGDIIERDTTAGAKLLFYEPDPMVPQARPLVVQPHTAGDFAGKVTTLGSQVYESIFPMSEVLKGGAPGRVDSASALAFLERTGDTPMLSVFKSMKQLFGRSARYSVMMAAQMFAQQGGGLKLTRLSEDLAGVAIDPDTLEASITSNQIPDPTRLTFSIKDVELKSKEVRVNRALEMTGAGLMSPIELRILNIKEDLGLPFYNPQEVNAYWKTILNIVLIFNDGETPNQALDNLMSIVPDIQLSVLNGFMSSVAVATASSEVREALIAYKEQIEFKMGQIVPEALGNPEEDAASREIQTRNRIGR